MEFVFDHRIHSINNAISDSSFIKQILQNVCFSHNLEMSCLIFTNICFCLFSSNLTEVLSMYFTGLSLGLICFNPCFLALCGNGIIFYNFVCETGYKFRTADMKILFLLFLDSCGSRGIHLDANVCVLFASAVIDPNTILMISFSNALDLNSSLRAK